MELKLGERLRLLRMNRKESQRAAAQAMGIEASTLSRYENSKRETQWEILAQIAIYYETSTDYLLGLTDNPLPSNWENLRGNLEQKNPELFSSILKMSNENRTKLSERALVLIELQENENDIP